MLFAVLALIIFQLLGNVIVTTLGIQVPGALMGMALMLIALCIYGRLPVALSKVCAVMLAHLMLLFIPSVVAIMKHAQTIADDWLPFIAAGILATAVTTITTAATLQFMLNRQNKKNAEHNS